MIKEPTKLCANLCKWNPLLPEILQKWNLCVLSPRLVPHEIQSATYHSFPSSAWQQQVHLKVLGTRGCTQFKGSLKFVMCSKSSMLTLLIFTASTQYAFIETMLLRTFSLKQRSG